MDRSPYAGLPLRAFWRSGVLESGSEPPSELFQRKWPILRGDRIATAGSCFAQHIGRSLKEHGFNVLDTEPAPPVLPNHSRAEFGYGIYAARYGNIYTARQLRQLAEEAFGLRDPGDIVWKKDDRFYDALRPGVEPEGLGSPEEVRAHRTEHLAAVREVFRSVDVFVFTFGLTEAWVERATGTVFPTAPGTIAGTFDVDRFAFHNFSFSEVLTDFQAFRSILSSQSTSRSLRLLLTVSPVPLTATASTAHVLQATVYSKAVLRAVAGELADGDPSIDYFPSFEIVCNPWGPERLYASNLRSVTDRGVSLVMQTFLRAHDAHNAELVAKAPSATTSSPPCSVSALADDPDMTVVCEDELLEAFGKSAR